MSGISWFIGGAIAAYAWKVATAPDAPAPRGAGTAIVPRNARRKDHPDLVSVVAHARAWPGTSLRAR